MVTFWCTSRPWDDAVHHVTKPKSTPASTSPSADLPSDIHGFDRNLQRKIDLKLDDTRCSSLRDCIYQLRKLRDTVLDSALQKKLCMLNDFGSSLKHYNEKWRNDLENEVAALVQDLGKNDDEALRENGKKKRKQDNTLSNNCQQDKKDDAKAGSVSRRRPQLHPLAPTAADGGDACDVCSRIVPPGETPAWCGTCDYLLCSDCGEPGGRGHPPVSE
eukprot:TRINITY_DN19477_c0_g2_i1.p1 TRINITY_DN19477_c0_g2~~TRINITY_DN19477_c0_g2_i1.p1  ORF type:complete len:217 (+),score=40.68 TRINITY_DN19477_c0_g2_i1:128-778(+)